jgi:hypothetical protein
MKTLKKTADPEHPTPIRKTSSKAPCGDCRRPLSLSPTTRSLELAYSQEEICSLALRRLVEVVYCRACTAKRWGEEPIAA